MPATYKFGSPELAELHARAWEPVIESIIDGWSGRIVRRVVGKVIGWEFDGFRYIVDHGSFQTLNTMRGGSFAVEMKDLPNRRSDTEC